ncbi:MAG: gamma-glutamyl-gamma-aminobutyrate hydrolase family protein, partial [Actinobacteria bacterium]|nr:gamma-glutamyl-gamma-aminobutyrate hydrolase family protein [Actinomycetota bacterium]
YHPISLDAQSRVARTMETESPTRSHSFHHQALKTIATGLHVVGRAPDGIIEAVEHESCRWVVGVQWHPEDDAASEREQQGLFE